jgi:hypothetical protein
MHGFDPDFGLTDKTSTNRFKNFKTKDEIAVVSLHLYYRSIGEENSSW